MKEILAAAATIQKYQALEARVDAALEGRGFMLRWDKTAAPGDKSYDGFAVTPEVAKDMIRDQFKNALEANRQLANDAVADLMAKFQPSAG
jgi:uncharacterized protein YcnI